MWHHYALLSQGCMQNNEAASRSNDFPVVAYIFKLGSLSLKLRSCSTRTSSLISEAEYKILVQRVWFYICFSLHLNPIEMPPVLIVATSSSTHGVSYPSGVRAKALFIYFFKIYFFNTLHLDAFG